MSAVVILDAVAGPLVVNVSSRSPLVLGITHRSVSVDVDSPVPTPITIPVSRKVIIDVGPPATTPPVYTATPAFPGLAFPGLTWPGLADPDPEED